MSRCLPYPNTGGVKKGSPGGIPTEPIKLRKERVRIPHTEKRKQNKRKENEETLVKHTDVNRGRTIRFVSKKSQAGKLGGSNLPYDKEKSDCLTRSSKLKEDSCGSVISEEHGQPISPESLCYLSDGKKSGQSKDASFPVIEKRGNLLRIRLPSQKQPVPEVLAVEQPAKIVPSSLDSCRSDGHGEVHKVASTSPRCSSLEPTAPSHCRSVVSEPEVNYESLLDQWVPPPLTFEYNASEDLDWLFSTKRPDEIRSKRLKTEVEVCSPQDKCSWPPLASYLPEAEIYALPYTVPF